MSLTLPSYSKFLKFCLRDLSADFINLNGLIFLLKKYSSYQTEENNADKSIGFFDLLDIILHPLNHI